jgi:hypothetical protein
MKNKKYHTTVTTQTFNTKIVTHKYMIAHFPGFLKENGEVSSASALHDILVAEILLNA